MKNFFVRIYRFFANHKLLMWFLLSLNVCAMVVATTTINVDENISSFFPSQNEQTDFVLKHMKAMDKIAIVVSPTSDNSDVFCVADALADSIQRLLSDKADLSVYVDDNTETELFDYVFSHLPLLLTEDDYARFDSITTTEAIMAKMAENKQLMTSPLGVGLSRLLPLDPLGLSYGALQKLQTLRPNSPIDEVDGYMTVGDDVVMFLTMHSDYANTGDNAQIVSTLRSLAQNVSENMHVSVSAFGAPMVAVCNSERVKADQVLTVSIAILLTAIILFLVFRRKRAIFLVVIPVAYGALFAFSIVSVLNIQLSLISVGTGAMVLGLAMSYSIHMLTHSLHSDNIENLVAEMTYPMTVGSITTIGAFVGLMFTNSKILHDLGLYASLALLGTLLFCMVFLPQFLSPDQSKKHSKTMQMIAKWASYDFAKNKILVASLAILTIVGLFFFTSVRFDADMNALNYDGDKWLEASKQKIENALTSNDTLHHTTLVVLGTDADELARNGEQLATIASQTEGVRNISSVSPWFLQSKEQQQSRIDRWNDYFTAEKTYNLKTNIQQAALANGFSEKAFDPFFEIISSAYSVGAENDSLDVFNEYLSEADGQTMLYVNMAIDNNMKDDVLDKLSECKGVVVADMGYFVRKATVSIVDNFNLILALTSILVFLALLIAYGRIELCLMTFMPMCISWIIILGLMAIFKVEFNVVNIILSTFIFGVGDDFSIFIMDGLLSRYRRQKDMLVSHKMAIALSGLAIIIGLGVQVFAQHPACKSIGYLSIFGLVAVILTSYVVQPILFRTFISHPAQVDQPYTMRNLLRSVFFYSLFLLGCLVGYVAMLFILILPYKLKTKKRFIHYVIFSFMHSFYKIITIFFPTRNIGTLNFSAPSVILPNHQSFIDIIYVLSLSPKIVCVTKSWVSNSPLFGPLVRFCDFYNADDGSEEMIEKMRSCVDDGYSIVIFPEGTRSNDGQIHRFHKGAFLLAQKLQISIQPIVIYGNGMIASKQQPLNLKDGWIVNKVLPIIDVESILSEDYGILTKKVCTLMRAELEQLKQQFDTPQNPYYREAILNQYVYKDMTTYWKMRCTLCNPQVMEHQMHLLSDKKFNA